MIFKVTEDQIVNLFERNLFHQNDMGGEYFDFRFERKFSFGERYKIGLCLQEQKLVRAIDTLISGDCPVDKVMISLPSTSSNHFWIQKVMSESVNFGSRVEILTVKNFLKIESSSQWEIDLRKELKQTNLEADAYFNLLKECSEKIAYFILQNEDNLWRIEWREFEKFITNALKEIGVQAELTPGSRDGGKDIICRLPDYKKVYYFELKLHRTAIKNSIVGDMKKTIEEENNKKDGWAYYGIVLSPKGFAKNVEVVHELRNNVFLADMRKVNSLCERYVRSQAGIYLPNEDFEKIILEDTF
ncbi:MAG: restriction endonuclease [Bacteroidetes bacterium]|nr:restriction endonuclease [Bacteroidota bacterium]